MTVRPRSTSTTTRRPSILRPSARLYAAESEVLTVNTTKSHRRLDHGFFLTRNRLTLIAYLIERLIFTSDCPRREGKEEEEEEKNRVPHSFR